MSQKKSQELQKILFSYYSQHSFIFSLEQISTVVYENLNYSIFELIKCAKIINNTNVVAVSKRSYASHVAAIIHRNILSLHLRAYFTGKLQFALKRESYPYGAGTLFFPIVLLVVCYCLCFALNKTHQKYVSNKLFDE